MNLTILLAQAAEGGGGAGAPAGCMGGQGVSSLVMMLLMFVVFYLVLIRPQQKKAKEHRTMLENLKKGDSVITRGGVIGKISGVRDSVLVIEGLRAGRQPYDATDPANTTDAFNERVHREHLDDRPDATRATACRPGAGAGGRGARACR